MVRKQRKVLLATGIGHFVEWFDFGLYGTLATFIGMHFFHAESPTTALLSSFAVFGAGFVMRPLGGLWFGSLGDRTGRRKVLVRVILLTSGATFAIGLLPTYSQVGLLATVLLVLARLVQGVAAGGESAGATTCLAEFAPASRRGAFTCWIDNFGFLAFVAASGLVLLLTSVLGDAAMNDWGWRIPFLVAGPLGWFGLWLRKSLTESPEFLALQQDHQLDVAPLRTAVTFERRALLFCIGFATVKAVGHWMLQAFIPGYLSTALHYPSEQSYIITTLGLLAIALMVPLMGSLSDAIGRKPLMLAGCVGFILLTWPAMQMMAQGDMLSAVLAMVLLGVCMAAFDGASSAAMAELFPTRIRYGSIAMGYNIAVAFFGGITPWFSTWLIIESDNLRSPALFVMVAALISFLTVLRAKETAGLPLRP